MVQNVLILGAHGRFGRNAASAFSAAGWQVTTFNRKIDDLMEKARNMDVIVMGWNPAYPDWARQVPDLHAAVIRAATASGATVIVPGNVYVYGANNGGIWREDTPHLADNPLGRMRISMERAYRGSGVRTILLRAGDFLDDTASGNWFDMILTKHLAKGVFTYPGRADIPHAWAYLPDLARAAVLLAEKRRELEVFHEVNFPGYTLSGQDIATLIAQVTDAKIRLKQMSWLPIRLAAPVWPLGRCLLEMRYLWDTSHRLESTCFDVVLQGFRHTPAIQAVACAIAHVTPVPQNEMSTQTSA
ncbi:epimerase [Shimia sp. SDUM112013]|uniref:epimerase n=1 Tax=Shimia sp. SDUM112013 TaxID=3136160 RepID=UPI0032EED853